MQMEEGGTCVWTELCNWRMLGAGGLGGQGVTKHVVDRQKHKVLVEVASDQLVWLGVRHVLSRRGLSLRVCLCCRLFGIVTAT